MAIRQSNTHQPKFKLITSLKGRAFSMNMYTTHFGFEKMKEIIRTRTPFTDWDPTSVDKNYGIRQLIDVGPNNVLIFVPSVDRSLYTREEGLVNLKASLPSPLNSANLWHLKWDKYKGSEKRESIYYDGDSAYGDLPFEYSSYNSKGTLVGRYIIQGERDAAGANKHALTLIDMNRKVRNNTTLKDELLTFVDTYNLTLPDHDIDDPRIYQIGVNYKDDIPRSITYYVYQCMGAADGMTSSL